MNEKYYAVVEENGQLWVSDISVCGDSYITEQPKQVASINFQDSENEAIGVDKGIMGWGSYSDNTINMNSAIVDIDNDVKENMLSHINGNNNTLKI